MTKVRSVTVHYPTPENEEEYDRRAAKAVARALCNTLPPEVIDELLRRLKAKLGE